VLEVFVGQPVDARAVGVGQVALRP